MMNAGESIFVAMRPPGHHAEPDKAMGFCFFSNAAIAARHHNINMALIKWRFLILMCITAMGHACFWHRSDCLYASTHEMPLFPGSGHTDEVGKGASSISHCSGMDGDDVIADGSHCLPRLKKLAQN